MPQPALGPGLAVLERGWLSSNSVMLHGGDGEDATLVDSGHCLHADQTVALVRESLRGGQTLARVLNTHLHSDHCGGNAALVRAFGAAVQIPPGLCDAVQRWDVDALGYRPSGQRCEKFAASATLAPGQSLPVGARTWQAHAAPGHDPHSLILFDAENGVLISADALWENGFGVVFPELDGDNGFDDVAATLDLIESLRARAVIPGHGAPFTDVAGALQRARQRLAGFRADPARHTRHAAKVLLKYHLLEEAQQALPALLDWFAATPLMQQVWQRQGRPGGALTAWGQALLDELAASGAVVVRGGVAYNA